MILHKQQRILFWVTFGVCLVAIGFLIASLCTDQWVEAFPVMHVDNETEDAGGEVGDGDLGSKWQGHIHFGLFTGFKRLDRGLGIREWDLSIKCKTSENGCSWKSDGPFLVDDTSVPDDDEDVDDGTFNFGLWLSTLIFICVGIAWGVVSMAFAVINASRRPIETITGPMGLYLWNGLASLFCLLAVIMYVVLYYEDLKDNVLSVEDTVVYPWTSKDRAHLEYSFYFVVVSTVLYAINLLIVGLSGVRCHVIRFGHDLDEKSMDNVIMY